MEMNGFKDAFKKAGMKIPEEKPAAPRKTSPGRAAGQAAGPQQNQPAVKLGQGYTSQAEAVILDLKRSMGRDYERFTTSKIRNILTQVNDIFNDVNNDRSEKLQPGIQSRIEHLKVRLVYECGREPYVIKPFVEKAGLLRLINEIGDNSQNFIDFARYMEALVAYHRFYGGKDS
jgi:CRISPR-associated protein Csm2